MIEMRTDEAAQTVSGTHHGTARKFRGLGTDSRQDLQDRLFVALRGPNFDGHEFIDDAVASGAAGVMLSEARTLTAPSIGCPDTLAALGLLGSAWAQRCPASFIGITGSNGKTTVKDMISSILSEAGRCLATQGNFNNEIGVPLTLARLSIEDRFAVIEMGAGKPGDIAYLTGLVQPHVGIVTNVGPAHLEFFHDLDGVAHEKGALYRALRDDGTAVINADDPYCQGWIDSIPTAKLLTFGLSSSADFCASVDGSTLNLQTPHGKISIEWNLPGAHHALNAAGAAAAALAAGAELDHVAAGLRDFKTAAGRYAVREVGRGVRLIDDAYNANPASLAAAIDAVGANKQRTWLVMGQLAELGPDTARYHREAGEHAREAGIERVFAVGENAEDAASGFGAGAECFSDHSALTVRLLHAIDGPVTILIKGSRSAGLERVVAACERSLTGAQN